MSVQQVGCNRLVEADSNKDENSKNTENTPAVAGVRVVALFESNLEKKHLEKTVFTTLLPGLASRTK